MQLTQLSTFMFHHHGNYSVGMRVVFQFWFSQQFKHFEITKKTHVFTKLAFWKILALKQMILSSNFGEGTEYIPKSWHNRAILIVSFLPPSLKQRKELSTMYVVWNGMA